MIYINKIYLRTGQRNNVLMDPNAEILSVGPSSDDYSVSLYVAQDNSTTHQERCFEVIQTEQWIAEPSTALFRGTIFIKDVAHHVFERLVL